MENKIKKYSDMTHSPDIRELTLINGLQYPSDNELIMLILGSGTKNMGLGQLSRKVMSVINSSNKENLINNLVQIEGIGNSKALAIAAALELGKRKHEIYKCTVTKPRDIIPFVKHLTLEPTEHFIVISVNGKKEVIDQHVTAIGTTNRALIHPREVFSKPIELHASGIICCHNHPADTCIPSTADVESTRILEDAAQVLGITFLDHIIVTKDAYFSFLEHGMLKK